MISARGKARRYEEAQLLFEDAAQKLVRRQSTDLGGGDAVAEFVPMACKNHIARKADTDAEAEAEEDVGLLAESTREASSLEKVRSGLMSRLSARAKSASSGSSPRRPWRHFRSLTQCPICKPYFLSPRST